MKFELNDLGVNELHLTDVSRASGERLVGAFKDGRNEIRSALLNSGALLVRDLFPLRDPAMFQVAIESLGFGTRDYVGGTSPRSVVKGKVMEATRTPENWSIMLHQEQSYMRDIPEMDLPGFSREAFTL